MGGEWKLTDGSWDGRRGWVVGGGPSLKEFDWRLLDDEPFVIAVNMAYRDLPNAAAFFTEDLRVIELVHEREDWRAFKGEKIFHALDSSYVPTALRLDPTLRIIERRRQDKYWAQSMPEGLSYSSNSMVGALNLIDILSARPIYLLGLDCNRRGIGGRERNYHDEYEKALFDRTGDFQYETFISDFRHWAAYHLARRGKTVINLNCDSSVHCWPQTEMRYNEAVKAVKEGRDVLAPAVQA